MYADGRRFSSSPRGPSTNPWHVMDVCHHRLCSETVRQAAENQLFGVMYVEWYGVCKGVVFSVVEIYLFLNVMYALR